MKRKKVALHHFTGIASLEDGSEFDESAEVLRSLISEYEVAATPRYGKWDSKPSVETSSSLLGATPM